jgi:hypothetical protein
MKWFINKARGLVRRVPLGIRRPLRRLHWFSMWVFPRLRGVFVSTLSKKQRVLVVYDTSSQPFSIGDILICQEASLVLCQKYQVDVVDFALVYDPGEPAKSNATFAAAINKDNVIYHIASLLPLAQVNQKLGSFFVLDSQEQLVRLIADNSDCYHVWPSGWQLGTHEYLSRVVFNDLLVEHHRQHGAIPHLTCRPHLREWAAQFYAEHSASATAVTVNLRNNPHWDTRRNSSMESWLALFKYCESRYKVKFFVICARIEIDARLRECPNVVFAKDFHTTVEQDMALIQASAMHMGAGSGPATMTWFGPNPYLMIDNASSLESGFYQHEHMVEYIDEHFRKYWFASPAQRIFNGLETEALLIEEFVRMFSALDPVDWQKSLMPTNGMHGSAATWLR